MALVASPTEGDHRCRSGERNATALAARAPPVGRPSYGTMGNRPGSPLPHSSYQPERRDLGHAKRGEIALTIAATAHFDYFDHDADIGIIGRGSTVEAAFESAAVAAFSVMGDIGLVENLQHVAVEFEEDDVEIAFVRLLNELLAQARLRRILLGEFRVAREGPLWRCLAHGGPWPAGADRGIEVKGATLTGLSVAKEDREWTARCVVDV